MKISWLAGAALAVALGGIGAVAQAAPTTHAAPVQLATAVPPSQICSSDGCINRSGGGITKGTQLLAWDVNDSHNGFAFLQKNNFVCGRYASVHNGEQGCVGPFAVGSGLNARYDGDIVYNIHSYDTGFVAAIPSFSSFEVKMGNFGDPGDAWVVANGGYTISVGESNWAYNGGNGANRPYWLTTYSGQHSKLLALFESGATHLTWFCNGPEDSCPL